MRGIRSSPNARLAAVSAAISAQTPSRWQAFSMLEPTATSPSTDSTAQPTLKREKGA
jgi:hypothetical protein